MLQEPNYISKGKGLLDIRLETGREVPKETKKVEYDVAKYNDKYLGKDILITGGSGMIGSALVEKLISLGARVSVYDNLYSEKLGKTQLKNRDGYQFWTIDMTHPFSLDKHYDFIFHLAAIIGGAGFVTKYAADTVTENSKMTINLYNAIHKLKESLIEPDWPHVIMFSSSTVFENVTYITEKQLPNIAPPSMDYAFQKLFNERVATSQYKQYKIPYTIIRPFNVYGPGEIATEEHGISHVIPDFYKRLKGMQPYDNFIIYGDGLQMRAYTYIDDLIHGVLIATKFPQSDFNIATTPAVEVIYLAEMMMDIMGVKYDIVSIKAPWHDIPKRVPNSSKIMGIGWIPQYSLRDGLKKTITWLDGQKK